MKVLLDLDPSLVQEIDEIAFDEGKSRSEMIEELLSDALDTFFEWGVEGDGEKN